MGEEKQLKWEPEVINETQLYATLSDGERQLIYIARRQPSPLVPVVWWDIHDATQVGIPPVANASTQPDARKLAEEYAMNRRRLAKSA